ncbi:acetyl-CoA C-acyltransferase [Gilvimarinus sp. F26214L]|uniref:acetyl-CoA C-acyltransferase n=1 Tax=Gilvimarinus sp. DZF01 TaxID=3461371 RepID=UPI004045D068
MNNDPIVIVSAARTPMAGMMGDFAAVRATELGKAAVAAALERAGVSGDAVDDVVMGCVLQAGQGQAPARQAALAAGIARSASCLTINKMCGSGLKATMLAHDSLLLGHTQVAVAGGMESMTNAPYLLAKARGGYRMGADTIYDHMMLDGLEDAYEPGTPMGVYAENTASHYGFTREQQDEFAITSLKRAQQAIADGSFAGEIAPVQVKTRKGEVEVSIDEQPGKARLDKIPQLRPAFVKDGTVTAANASSISDGAAALVMMRQSEAEKRGLTPLARIAAHASFSQEPQWFTTAPVGAMKRVFEKSGWSAADVDLYEINEAFAVVTMAAMKDLDLPHDKVNVHGGACALGHPIGASGARILVTLLAALEKYDLQKGVASLCIGGGEAVAVGVERLK